MKAIILLSIIGYFIYRVSQVLLPFFLFSKKNSQKEKKEEFHRKVQNMDIQDAEYEDKWNTKNIYLSVQMIEEMVIQEKVAATVVG